MGKKKQLRYNTDNQKLGGKVGKLLFLENYEFKTPAYIGAFGKPYACSKKIWKDPEFSSLAKL